MTKHEMIWIGSLDCLDEPQVAHAQVVRTEKQVRLVADGSAEFRKAQKAAGYRTVLNQARGVVFGNTEAEVLSVLLTELRRKEAAAKRRLQSLRETAATVEARLAEKDKQP